MSDWQPKEVWVYTIHEKVLFAYLEYMDEDEMVTHIPEGKDMLEAYEEPERRRPPTQPPFPVIR